MLKTKAYKFILKVRKFQLPTVYSFSTAEGETWLWVDSAPCGLNSVNNSRTASPIHMKLSRMKCFIITKLVAKIRLLEVVAMETVTHLLL